MDTDEHGFFCRSRGNEALTENWKQSETPDVVSHEAGEPRLGRAGKFQRPAAPDKFDRAGVEGVVFKNQAGALRGGEPAFDKGQVAFLVAAVDLVADDGMAEVGEVDADLVFAAGAGEEAQKRKRSAEHRLGVFQ